MVFHKIGGSISTTIYIGLITLVVGLCGLAWPEASSDIFCPVEGSKARAQIGTLATLPDGRVFTWFVRGKNYWKALEDPAVVEDLQTPQRAYARWSEDNGRTWSEPKVIFEFPRVRGVRIAGTTLCDRKGLLHIFGLNYIQFDRKTLDPAKFDYQVWHAVSADAGATWSALHTIDHGHTTFGWMNSVIQLRTGRILMPLAYLSSRKTGRWVSTCIYSDDNAQSWQHSRSHLVVDSGGADIESGACEPVVVELGDGRVWMLIRTQTGYQYESFSRDGGQTWSEPVQSRFVSTNSPVQVLRLRDGRIVLAWNNCSFGNTKDFRGDRAVVAVAISADDGNTWRGYREVARRNTSGIVAYPFMTETPNGNILMYLWGGDFLLRFSPNWLTETSLIDDFSAGLNYWAVTPGQGVTLVDHPDKPGAKALALRKHNPGEPSAAVRNFPFGERGRLDLRLRLAPGFQGAGICLTDFFSLPAIVHKGRFALCLHRDGSLRVTPREGEPPQPLLVPIDRWFTMSFIWNCGERRCVLLLDESRVAELPQLPAPNLAKYQPNLAQGQRTPEAYGICYLRLWSLASERDEAGLLIESLRVCVEP